jgi:DHA1 family inner membrane transport protein
MTEVAIRDWRIPVVALLVATFAVCTTELIISGILPALAQDLTVDIPTAGLLITGYAVSVAIGGPLLALVTARLSRRLLMLTVLGIFVVGNIVCALSVSYGMLLGARLILAASQGLFFSVVMVLATRLAPAGRQSSAVSMVMIGVNMATILGVPLGTAIGNAYGWRMSLWIIAIAVGVAAVVLAVLIPPAPANERPAKSDFRAELAAALRMPVLLCYASIAFSLLAFFVMVAYIVPFLTVGGGLSIDMVPLALLGIGLAGFAGNLVGGRLGDWNPVATMLGTLAINTILFVILAQVAASGWVAVGVMLVIWCIGFAFPAPAQARIMREVADAPSFAASLTNTSFQIGIACGAAVGGAALAAGVDYTRLPLLSALSLACAFAATLWLSVYDRRRRLVAA